MEKLKITPERDSNLSQNKNEVLYTLLNPLGENITSTNIMCKDYYQEIIAYLYHDYFLNETQYGFTVTERLDSLKNADTISIALKVTNGRVILSSDAMKNNLDRIKELLIEINATDIIDNYAVHECKDNYWVVTIHKNLHTTTYNISLLLKLLRGAMLSDLIEQPISSLLDSNAADLNSQFISSLMSKFHFLEKEKENWTFVARKKAVKEEIENINDNIDDPYMKTEIARFHNNTGIVYALGKVEIPSEYISILTYGTLRKGFGNHHFVKNAIYGGIVKLEPALSLTFPGEDHPKSSFLSLYELGYYPGLKVQFYDGYSEYRKLRLNGNKIIFEQYFVTKEELKRIDYLEGFRKEAPESGLYNKASFIQNGIKTYVYIYNHEVREDKLIISGDYKNKKFKEVEKV